MKTIKAWAKGNPIAKGIFLWCIRVFAPLLQIMEALQTFWRYGRFFSSWRQYLKLGGKANITDFYPCVNDLTPTTSCGGQYFFQPIWAMKRIKDSGVTDHVDIGSQINFVGMLTTICKVTFIDIRPLEIFLENYQGKAGSITCLPYPDFSLNSISCLHVMEHIGLGRYGDPLDPQGSEKASRELMRVLAPQGKLYLTVPTGVPRVCFNGHRIFSVEEIIRFFDELHLVEFSMVDFLGNFHEMLNPSAMNLHQLGEAGNDFALGMFIFTRKDLSKKA